MKSTQAILKRILIAGVGNVLNRDDGFGVEVVHRLKQMGNLPANVKVIETGIGGISLVQELFDEYDVLLVVDTISLHGKAGDLYLIEANISDIHELPIEKKQDFLADMHYTNPNKALKLAKALNVLPSKVYILGCEPKVFDEFNMGLTEVIQQAVPKALDIIQKWLAKQIPNSQPPKPNH